MAFIIIATTRSNETRYYTGRADEGWMSANHAEAFSYSSQAEAERKAANFTKFSSLHGMTCNAETR